MDHLANRIIALVPTVSHTPPLSLQRRLSVCRLTAVYIERFMAGERMTDTDIKRVRRVLWDAGLHGYVDHFVVRAERGVS